MSQAGWTDERVEQLKKLWTDGLSASQIAKALGGVTRNAVIGKVHRLGLAGRAAPSRPVKRIPVAAPAPKPRIVTPASPGLPPRTIAPLVAVAAPASALAAARPSPRTSGDVATVDVLGLKPGMCKWPVGDPGSPGFGFCGKHTADGKVYCEEHAAVAYQPAAPRKKTRRDDDAAAAEIRRYARLAAL